MTTDFWHLTSDFRLLMATAYWYWISPLRAHRLFYRLLSPLRNLSVLFPYSYADLRPPISDLWFLTSDLCLSPTSVFPRSLPYPPVKIHIIRMCISSGFTPFNFYPVKSESHLIRARGPFIWGQLNDLNHHNDRNVFKKPKNVNMSRMFRKSLVTIEHRLFLDRARS